MQKQEVKDLLKKYLAGNCSEKERGILETWYLKYEEKEVPEITHAKKEEQLDEIWEFLSQKLGKSAETNGAVRKKISMKKR